MITSEQSQSSRDQYREQPATLSFIGISLSESTRIAMASLTANKLRSILTALGVIIGVATIISLLALGRGAQAQIVKQITANGANLLTVFPGSLGSGGFSSAGSSSQTLTVEDAQALADPANVPEITLVSPESINFGPIVAGSQNTSAMITGVTSTFLAIHNHSIGAGEPITDEHLQADANVAMLGSRMAATLFSNQDPIGQSIRINGQLFRVIGVLTQKGGGLFGSIDDSVIGPLTTAQRKLFSSRDANTGKLTVSSIVVQVRDAESLQRATAQMATILRERHHLPSTGVSDDFIINNQQNLIDALTGSQRTLTLYLGAIAAISLVVGGIGIMNIMLVSVHERTREIGLRKAIGARERDILLQFLIEALALSTLGGLMGLLIGILVAFGSNRLAQSGAVVGIDSVALALGFAIAIGVFFGIEPARRAARLDPIEALRRE